MINIAIKDKHIEFWYAPDTRRQVKETGAFVTSKHCFNVPKEDIEDFIEELKRLIKELEG